MRPEEELRFLILGAQREGSRLFAEHLAPLGITPAQAEVLRCLSDAGAPLSLLELGRRLVCETGSPSRLVSTLVERELVERLENRNDRRQVTLRLTEAGESLVPHVGVVEAGLHAAISRRLDANVIAATVDALRALLGDGAAVEAIELRKTRRERFSG